MNLLLCWGIIFFAHNFGYLPILEISVFKVETIGDSYVAVAGLPEAREDHAEAMALFAHNCRDKLNQVVKKLEVILGPDTGTSPADIEKLFKT